MFANPFKAFQFKTFGVFLVLSALFWLFGKLSEEYIFVQEFQLRYSGTPEELLVITPPPEKIEAQLKGSGFQILASKFFRPVIRLDFTGFEQDGKSGKYYYLPNRHLPVFQKKFYRWEWRRFLQDSITFTAGKKETRLVPVVNRVKIICEPGYQVQGGIRVSPDSIRVMGPQQLLENIPSVSTRALTLDGINDSIRREVGLEIPVPGNAGITLQPAKVLIRASIVRFTEMEWKLPVRSPARENLKIIPDSVRVVLQVPFERYPELLPDAISLSAGLSGHSKTVKGKSPVHIVRKPDFVNIIRIDPDSVMVWKVHGTKR